MKPPNKDYSASEVLQMFQQVTGAVMNGNLQNTVFGAPEDSSAYDALASNVQAMRQNYINRYAGSMLQAQKFKRVRAIAAATGMGHGGIQLIDQIAQMNPAIGQAILGHHGADEALNSMLANANGLAAARGLSMGGMTDPRQMNRNMMWAASQGALAFNNNFNKYGAVDANFTRGLSLGQSAAVSNNIMADRSHYEEWEKEQLARTAEWQRRNPKATNEQRLKEGILTEAEIKSFRHGTAMSEGAVKSFNEKIKSFQSEINGFVSSISKITGDFDSAVDFLQDMTNGKAFSAGKEAEASRRKAANMAANLRIMAAEGGVDPKTMYKMMYDPVNGFGSIFDSTRGVNSVDQIFGERSTTAHMSALAAGSYAEWSKANPNATQSEKDKAWASLQHRVQGFAKGDAVKHNVLLAEAVRTGEMTSEEAQKLAGSGNQQAVAKRLKEIYGNNLNAITRDRRMMEFLTTQNSDMVESLNKTSFDEGITNEGATKGHRNALSSAKRLLKTQLRKAVGKGAGAEIERMHLESMFDDSALKDAGLSDEQIEEAKALMQSGKFKTADAARKYLVKHYGADEMSLNASSFDALEQKVSERYGDNEQAAKALKTFKSVNKRINGKQEITSDDVKKYRMGKRSQEISRGLLDIKAKYDAAIESGDVKAADAARAEMEAETLKAVRGEGDTDYGNVEFVRSTIESFIQGRPEFEGDKNRDAREKLIANALARYDDAAQKGKTFDQRMKLVGSYLTNSGKGNAGLGGTFQAADAKGREKAFLRYKRQNSAAALFKHLVDRTNMSQADKDAAADTFYKKFREQFSDEQIEKMLNENTKLKNLTGEDREAVLASEIARSIAEGGGIGPEQITSESIRAVLNDDKLVQKTLDDQRRFHFGLAGADKGKLNDITGQNATEEEKRALRKRQIVGGDNIFAKNRAGLFTSGAVSSASSNFDQNNRNMVEQADRIQAIQMSKSFGIPGEFSREEYVRKLKIGEKIGALESMFQGDKRLTAILNGTWSADTKKRFTGKEGVDVSEEDIANAFKNILRDTRAKGLSEEETKEYIQNHSLFKGNADLYNAIFKQKDTKGNNVSATRMMSAYVAAASEKDASKRKTKLEDGYISQSVAEGDRSLVQEQALSYFKSMENSLHILANRTQ